MDVQRTPVEVHHAKSRPHDYRKQAKQTGRYRERHEKLYFNYTEEYNNRTSTRKQKRMDVMDNEKSRKEKWQ